MYQSGGINNCKRETEVIVSLTSVEKHFKFLPITLSSIFNQTLKPDRIILWLDEKEFNLINLPYEITKFIKNGLEIQFIKNLGIYNNTIYSFKHYPDSIIVTAEDTVYYPSEWLKKLYMSYIANPNEIHAHKTVGPSDENASYKYIPNNNGGILYPPKCFSKEALRNDIFLKNAPKNTNVWFWVMALVHGRKIRVVKNHIKLFVDLAFFNKNNNKDYSQQIDNLMKFYGENIKNKLSK